MSLETLNFHHLLYFRAVAREGGLVKAASRLRVSPATISTQIKLLEEQVGDALFLRTGRRLVLTDLGRLVLRYADGVFDLGEELRAAVRQGGAEQPTRLTVGLSMVVPKLIAHRILEPVLRMEHPVELVCIEDKRERLLADLATFDIDLVLTDSPLRSEVAVRAFNHLLGECGVTFCATPEMARAYAPGFPQSLDAAPMLWPLTGTALRTELEHWFQDIGIRPRAIASLDDSALTKVFGATGAGLFPTPTVIEQQVCEQYGVEVIGRTDQVRERYYAISIEQKLKHPAVVAISNEARSSMFA